MEIDVKQFNEMGKQIQQELKDLTPKELMDKALEHHLKVINHVVIAGWHFSCVLESEGAQKLSQLLKDSNQSELLARAEIKVYDESKLLSQTIQDPTELTKQVGLSIAYEHYDALFHSEVLNALGADL